MQGAEAGTCSECKKTYEDQGKTCSAADVYVACAEKDCTSLFQIFKVAPAKAAQLACGAEAGTCSECKKTYEDKGKTCSAADVYVACVEKDCTSWTDIFKVASAKTAHLTCGAGSILVNLTVIVLGLTLYTLF
ncbi:Hypothetical predicted protein [Mytilus galloprovincialis]|nr:Hypothetical predicted protein [Mytilus galloprovincialis]